MVLYIREVIMDANDFKKDFKQTFVYVLKTTTLVGDFKYDDLNQFFEESYADDDNSEHYHMWISLLNSVFTHMSKTFIVSRATMYYLCYHDMNRKTRMKIHANNYSTFLSLCFERGYIKRLREPTGRRGGVYQIISPKVVSKLNEIQGKIFFEEQEKYVLNAYDSNGSEDFELTESCLPGTKEERRAKLLERLEKDSKEDED